MTDRSEFVDRLYDLDVKQTRACLASSMAAVRSLTVTPGPRGRVLQEALSDVEAALLAAARAALVKLDDAMHQAARMADPEPADSHDAVVAGLDEGRPPPPRPAVAPRRPLRIPPRLPS